MLGVDAVEMAHQARQVGLVRLQDEVVVVAHEAVGKDAGVEAVCGLGEDGQVLAAVFVAAVDGLATVAAGGDVVDDAGELEAKERDIADTVGQV